MLKKNPRKRFSGRERDCRVKPKQGRKKRREKRERATPKKGEKQFRDEQEPMEVRDVLTGKKETSLELEQGGRGNHLISRKEGKFHKGNTKKKGERW